MKKTIIILLGLSWLIGGSFVFAQRQVEDYTYQYEKYRTQYEEFALARNEYLKQLSLTSQKDAIEKTKNIVFQRAQALRVYLLALKYLINRSGSIVSDDKNRLSADLDQETVWLQNHMDDVSRMSSPTLTDLFEISKRLENKHSAFIKQINENLAYILIGRVRQVNQEYVATLNTLLPLVEGSKNRDMRNWYDQALDMSNRCEQSLKVAEDMIKDIKNESEENRSIQKLNLLKNELNNGKKDLESGVAFQQEILKQLNKSMSKQTLVPTSSPATESAVIKP